ncbi:MAG: universal stress protein [Candidatus Melainabacteria bacterium]|nr:universal stress protein [Candidatus Melainabacteria bacterium]
MRIVIAIDDSDCSQMVLQEAELMDCPVGTEIKIVTALDYSEPLPVLESLQVKECEEAKQLIGAAIKSLKIAHPCAEVSGEVLDGYPADSVNKISRDWLGDLIMVGSHSRKGVSKLWLGSVSRAILMHAPCAVRVVKSGSKPTEESQSKNVLLALEDTEHSSHLIDHTLALPWFEGTKFRCLHVIHPIAVVMDEGSESIRNTPSSFDGFLHRQIEWLDTQTSRINKHFDQEVATGLTLIGDAREQILLNAAEWPADLIMLGSHGRRGIDKLIMGSVSDTVSTNAQCSVEITRVPAFRKRPMHVIL